MPKITVIMPSLNVASYMRQCLRSVLEQTLEDIEVVAVDAGSTDGTLEILQEYVAADRRISVIQSDKRSYGYQVNVGLEAAQGEYISIVETDDRIADDMYEMLYAVARDHAREDIGIVPIYNGHMEIWGQEEENLYQTAMRNMRADGEADFIMLETVVKHILQGITLSDEESKDLRSTNMYILTNHRRRFGAAEILDKRTLRMVADKVGDGFIVLPSSVHETIILLPKEEAEYGRMADGRLWRTSVYEYPLSVSV